MENGHIKRYQKGRVLGKVKPIRYREDLHNAFNLSQNRLEKDMQPKLSKKKRLQRARPNRNFSHK